MEERNAPPAATCNVKINSTMNLKADMQRKNSSLIIWAEGGQKVYWGLRCIASTSREFEGLKKEYFTI